MCCKEQYCIGTWNVRFLNQGKLEVVKQEVARMNVNILGIRELKWTGMGEFNSNDHYIYHCGQESLRRNAIAIIVNKRVWNVVLGCNLKNDRMIPVSSTGKESTCNAGDPGPVPGSGRSPGEENGYPLQYSWASLVAQTVKNPCAMRRPGSDPWIGRSPGGGQPLAVFLPGETPWTGKPGRLQSMG